MSDKSINILLAEDDLNLGRLLADYLQTEGYQVKLYQDGEAAATAFEPRKFDLCILDVMMPKLDGFSLAKRIRDQDDKVPVIFITAKFLKQDKLKGYNSGADDYVVKPFDEEELLWKIKALLRRSPLKQKEAVEAQLSLGRYSFDIYNQSLTLGAHKRRITERECEILKYLSDRRNTLIKRDAMLKELWGENDYFLGRSLDVFITKIRKYLKEDPTISIENVYKVGFIFNVPDQK